MCISVGLYLHILTIVNDGVAYSYCVMQLGLVVKWRRIYHIEVDVAVSHAKLQWDKK